MSDPYLDVDKNERGYSDQFFLDHYEPAAIAMEHMLPILLESGLYVESRIYSAVDFGCGLGSMLKVLEQNGTEVTVGVDGWWVNRAHVEVEDFRVEDINCPVDLQRRFGLVISLEVAEHLPESSAEILVQTLVDHGSRVIFSCAIPGQGGRGHQNEQWPEYWAKMFVRHGYYPLDIIREVLWEIPGVAFWYVQNTLMFVCRKKLQELKLMYLVVEPGKLRKIHPKCSVKDLS